MCMSVAMHTQLTHFKKMMHACMPARAVRYVTVQDVHVLSAKAIVQLRMNGVHIMHSQPKYSMRTCII